MRKQANILDWPRPDLDPQIFNAGSVLKPEVKKFILDFISSFAQANNFKDVYSWITDIKFVGSLTTNCYNSNSDMDIHIVVDLPKFVEIEHPEMSEQEASDYLDGIRKQVDQVKAKVPGTEHPTEIYFENKFTTIASQEFSGTYSVLNDEWIKYPHIVDQTFDIEKLHPDLLNLAKETASELDAAFGEIKRDVSDIKDLQETINEWPVEQRSLFEKKLQKRLDELETEIKGLVDLREDVAEKRKHYKALSEQEVRFKYLQKYFYMHVLTDLKTLLKQSPDLSIKDIPVVENIMAQSNLNIKALGRGNSAWISPEGTVFPLSEAKVQTHADWLDKEYKWLHKKYGFTIDNSEGEYNDYDPASFCGLLVAEGWSRVGDIENVSGTGVEVPDMHNISTAVFDFVLSNLKSPNEKVTFEDAEDNYVTLVQEEIVGGQKAVNKALSQKRMSTASKHEDSAEGRICIDFDQTIAIDKENGTIEKPEPNAKAAIDKLKADGWYIIIFSHRSTTEYGEDQIKEFLDKYDIPYDEIYTEKPNAEFFVDDRAITFTTWDDVLKKVDTSHLSEKKAAIGWPAAFWVDPNGKIYDAEPTHDAWIEENIKLLKDNYGIDIEELFGHNISLAAVNYVISKGWTRIAVAMNGKDFIANVYNLRSIPTHVIDFLLTAPEGAKIVLEDKDSRNYVQVDKEDLLSGQKGINRAIQMQKQSFKILSKKEAGYNPLMDDSLKQGPPYAIYIGEQEGFDEMPAVKLYNIFGDSPRFGSTVSEQTLQELGIPILKQEKKASFSDSVWIDPKGKIYKITNSSHEDWALEKQDFLEKNYGIKWNSSYATKDLLENGWVRIGDIGVGETGFGIEMLDLAKIPSFVFDYIFSNLQQNDTVALADEQNRFIELPVKDMTGGQKDINRELFLNRVAQLGSEYDFSSTHFLLPKELSEKIIRWAIEEIPEDQIVHDEKDPSTKGIQLESHITLKYGLKTDNFEEVENALEGEKAPHIKFGKTSFFEPKGKDYDVIIIKVESDDLQKLNEKLCNNVEHDDLQFKEYHPHVTVAYVKKGLGKQFDGKDIITGEELDLSELIFSPKSGEKRTMELKGTNKESSFMPSNTDLAPSNDWISETGYPGNSEMDAPQNVSDEQTYYSPENDRPRSKNFLKRMLSLFQKPLSKKEPNEIVPVKEASSNVFFIDTDSGLKTKVLRDPTPEQAMDLYTRTRGEFHQIRWVVPNDGHLYMWDAYDLTHWDAIQQLGIPTNQLKEDTNSGVIYNSYEAKSVVENFQEGSLLKKAFKQWTTPEEPINNPKMDWQWSDSIYQYVGDNWQDLLSGWMNLDPKNYVKPVIAIEKIYEDDGGVSAWVHIEFVNTSGNTDAFMKLIISANIEGHESIEPEGREFYQSLTDWEIDVKDYGKSDELEKTSITSWSGPAYRVQTGYEHDPNATAADVVRYEQQELGNPLNISNETIKQLSNIPAMNVVWVTKNRKDVTRYKDSPDDIIEQINLPENSTVLAEDGDGGYLVLMGGFEKTSSAEKLINIGKFDNADILVPEDLLNKYIATISQHYKGLSPQEAYAMDLERSYLHKQLINYVLKNTLSNGLDVKYDKDVSFSIDQLISDFAEAVAYKENSPRETEKESSYGPTNYKGPSIADHDYQNSAWDGMNVTLSDEEDEKFLDQNGADGYPNRWMGRHRGPFYTDEGKVLKMLEDTKPQKQAAISGEVTNHILNLIHQNGGATWNMSKGNLVGQPYFAVAIYPQKEQIVDEADFDNLEGYLTSNEGLLSNSNNSFGAWVSNGKTYYAVVTTITDKNEAMKLGQQHGQLAIFSLRDMKEIPLQRVASLKRAAWEGGWISPQGQFYSGRDHAEMIMNNPKLFGIPKNLVKPRVLDEDLFRLAYDNGWVRVRVFENMLLVEASDFQSAKKAESFIFEHLNNVQAINLVLRNKQYQSYSDDFKIDGWESFSEEKMAKLAGVYSDKDQQAIYDKIYSERWRDDSAPIDGGNEYYDWSELGSNDYPNPKDEEKEHVYMDMLDDPAVANFPAGLPEYWVTFYDSNPNQGDQGGI